MGFVSTLIIIMVVVIISYMYIFGLVIVHYNILLDGDNFLDYNLQNSTMDNNNNLDTEQKMQGTQLGPRFVLPGAPPPPVIQIPSFGPPLPPPYHGGYQQPGCFPPPPPPGYGPPQQGHGVHHTHVDGPTQHPQLTLYPTKEPQPQYLYQHQYPSQPCLGKGLQENIEKVSECVYVYY